MNVESPLDGSIIAEVVLSNNIDLDQAINFANLRRNNGKKPTSKKEFRSFSDISN